MVSYSRRVTLLAASLAFLTAQAGAQDIFIYPNNGQTSEQQAQDRYECHVWAVDQTGFDPSKALAALPQAPDGSEAKKKPLKSAAGGAALGAAVGAVLGKDVGKSAAIGAGTGLLGAGLKNRRSKKKAEEAYEADLAFNQAYIETKTTEYNRAIGACLEGRNYTVK